MNETLQWLLRLDRLRFGEAGVEFAFARPIPSWGWALVALGAIVLAWISYRRLEGARLARILLAAARAAVLILLAVIIAGPQLVRPNEVEESDWVLVLVDRSASLTVKDLPGPGGGRMSRDEQLRAALEASRDVWRELDAERILVWLGFDAGAYELKPADAPGDSAPAVPILNNPEGRRTDLNRALEQALRRAAARPLSGVVVLSDGRSIDEPSRALLRRLEAEKIPVFTVPIGSRRGVADLAVRRVEAPRTAFVNDAVPVEVEVERLGDTSGDATARVELVDSATGAILETEEVDFAAEDPAAAPAPSDDPSMPRKRTVTLLTRPSLAGSAQWTVRIRPGGPSGDAAATIAQDLVEENNAEEVGVELVDRPLRVLYLDGYPRWEYRYLKNVLVREPSIASVVTILAPGRRYIQEGTEVLDALPSSPEEWGRFDVLILGDVTPTVFTTEQLTQIRERVGSAGLGLVWVGGEGAVPNEWFGTPLADLLPFATGGDGSAPGSGSTADRVGAWGEPIVMVPTEAADRIGVLRLADERLWSAREGDGAGLYWPPMLSDPQTGWALLRWAQRIDPSWLKPTAEVLALARPALARGGIDGPAPTPSSATPLVLSMRYGAGRSIYVGTDEIWRWRYGRGEIFTERFWLQIVRLLGRESVARSGKPALLTVLPDRGQTERPIRIEITLLDQALVQARPRTLRVRITRAGTDEAAELVLAPESSGGASIVPGRATTFATTWIPVASGRYRVEAIDPLLVSAGASVGGLAASVEVWQPDDELRRPQTDHDLLARLSRATGGQVLGIDELAQLPRLLPNRRLKLAGEPDVQTLWDTPLALILIVSLLTLEWVGRRLLRLA